MSGEDKNEISRAVALEYTHPGVPKVIAKGDGNIARKIVEEAEKHGIMIEQNPALAEALSHVALDEEIPEELYKAVAQVISYVMRMSRKMPT